MRTIVSRGSRMNGVGLGFGAPVTEESLRQVVPGIFTDRPGPRVSSRYGFVSTQTVLDALREEGWTVVAAASQRSRDPENRPFARHTIRMRHPDLPAGPDGTPEAIMRNGHNGNASYELLGGYFRTICSNGMIVNSTAIGSFKVFHSINAVKGVVEATKRVAEGLPRVVERIEDWRRIDLPMVAQRRFADLALATRWDDGEAPVDAPALLQSQRPEDDGDDVWRVLNRLQENVLRGCEPTPGWVRPTTAKGHVKAIRAVRAVDAQVRINRALWAIAEDLAPVG